MWDLRKNDVLYKMSGHTDTVTGLRLSPDGSFVLSNAMDNTGWCELNIYYSLKEAVESLRNHRFPTWLELNTLITF